MVGCWRCCGVWCVVCVQVVVWCVYVHVVLCWWCVGVVCVCMWCCAWVLCGGGGGVVRCVGVVLVLCWCGVGCVWVFSLFFLSFSQLYSLSFSICLPFLSSLSFLLLFSLLSSFFSFSLSFTLSFQTLCKEPINQQTSRRSNVIWRTTAAQH